jgi:hypothetical protein
MSGIISNTANYSQERGAVLSYRESIFLGNRSANNPYTATVNIGEPNLNRRLIMHMRDDIPGQNVNLVISAKVNGTTVPRVGARPDGYPITTQFTTWVSNWSYWVSPVIPTGSTATLELDSNASMWWGPVVIYTVINLKNTTPTVVSKTTSPWDITVPAGGFALFSPTSTDFNANNSPSTITNATLRIRERTGAPNLTLAHYGGFDYANTTPLSQSVNFQPDQGLYRSWVFR